MVDSSVEGGFVGDVRFPEFADSFVVATETLASAGPELESVLSAASLSFYKWMVTKLPRPFVVIDDGTFRFDKSDFTDALSPEEAEALVAALWPKRVKSSSQTSPPVDPGDYQ
jgi:hypothetical protein